MTTLIIVASAILGTGLTLFALFRLHDPTIGPAVAVMGLLLAVVPLLVVRGLSADATQNRTVQALEDRYGVTIEEYVLSETPMRWRIDGDWFSCYLVDLDAPVKDLDLRCAAHDALPVIDANS